jgi:hypothetical protein
MSSLRNLRSHINRRLFLGRPFLARPCARGAGFPCEAGSSCLDCSSTVSDIIRERIILVFSSYSTPSGFPAWPSRSRCSLAGINTAIRPGGEALHHHADRRCSFCHRQTGLNVPKRFKEAIPAQASISASPLARPIRGLRTPSANHTQHDAGLSPQTGIVYQSARHKAHPVYRMSRFPCRQDDNCAKRTAFPSNFYPVAVLLVQLSHSKRDKQ